MDASDEDVENLHFSNIDEQYVDAFSLKSLAFNNTSTSISLMSVNMRSLVNLQNFSKLEALICSIELKPDIISITETWAKPHTSGPYYSLCGYNFISNCRKLSVGGVGIYVTSSIHFSIIDKLTIMKEKLFESVFINIEF